MGRTNNKQVSALLTGDWHLRLDSPVARIDDFPEVVWEKVKFISDLQKKYNCPVWHSGDLFHTWKPSPELLSKTIENLPKDFWTIYGNHDLPQHNLELSYKCGINTLWKAGKLGITHSWHWGADVKKIVKSFSPLTIGKRNYAIWHVMTYKGKELPWPGCSDSNAKKLLKKFPDYDLILTGHNHKTFVEEYKGRLLVNPGSIFRMSADQVDHKPSIFLYYTKTNTVEQVFIPITPAKKCISRKHIDGKVERDNRIDAFVSRLDTDWKKTMSFEDNLQKFYSSNNTKKSIKQIVTKVIE